ncbi:MAG: sigma-70 family RNA polymerase sigma factor [Tannerella sp.]|jgi:RNA polymerase sigma-70 factor (ECF subfamily)|nr:sigma-70 family RNA polymerase sigma factor [Tannerella sp.]
MLSKTEFENLYIRYFDAIRNYVFYRCGDTDTASDTAQDVFLRVWEKRKQLHNKHLEALLYKMANDLFISNYRKEQTRMNFEQALALDNEGADISPEEEMQYRQLMADYATALDLMPENQRIVFLMSRDKEMKYSEIAIRLNISVKAVEKRMTSAIKFLRINVLHNDK